MTTPIPAAAGPRGVPGVPAQPGAPGGSSVLVAPEQRGRTEIPDRVVTRIATRAAGEVARVREVRERGGLPWTHSSHARVDGGLAAIRLDVDVVYPAPLRAVTAELRDHVTRRVLELTGLEVARVDIAITSFTSEARS